MRYSYTIVMMLTITLSFQTISAQTIPTGACGLQYTYDASGNLLSRQYVCVTAVNMSKKETNTVLAKHNGIGVKKGQIAVIQPVTALYAEKKSGKINVLFDTWFDNTLVTILNADGRNVKEAHIVGNLLSLDLSLLNAGEYVLKANDKSLHLSQKIAKL